MSNINIRGSTDGVPMNKFQGTPPQETHRHELAARENLPTKSRWSEPEVFFMAEEEPKIALFHSSNYKNINQLLSATLPGGTLEDIKGKRHPPKYKELVGDLINKLCLAPIMASSPSSLACPLPSDQPFSPGRPLANLSSENNNSRSSDASSIQPMDEEDDICIESLADSLSYETKTLDNTINYFEPLASYLELLNSMSDIGPPLGEFEKEWLDTALLNAPFEPNLAKELSTK